MSNRIVIDFVTMMDIVETVTPAESADLLLKLYKCAIDSDYITAKSSIQEYYFLTRSRKHIKQWTVTAQESAKIAERARELEKAKEETRKKAAEAAKKAKEREDKLKNNVEKRTVKNNDNSDYVYLVKCGDAYKIGVTNNIKRRISGIQTSNPHKVELIHSICTDNRNSYAIESGLHKHFEDKRLIGEWFELDDADVEFIKNINENAENVVQ